jgi:excisionase family DNA binding protein
MTLSSIDEAAGALKIGRRTIQRWISEAKLTGYRIEGDKRRYVDLEEIRRLREPQPMPRKSQDPGWIKQSRQP